MDQKSLISIIIPPKVETLENKVEMREEIKEKTRIFLEQGGIIKVINGEHKTAELPGPLQGVKKCEKCGREFYRNRNSKIKLCIECKPPKKGSENCYARLAK